MSDLTVRPVGPGFGSIVEGYEPAMLDDPAAVAGLREIFDRWGVVVFRGRELSYEQQVRLCEQLIGKPRASMDDGRGEGNWYVSNRRPNAAAPYGRLQFHMDTAWAHEPNEIVSLYASELEPPVAPTTFSSTTRAYDTLPESLRRQIEGLEVINSAGQIRHRGDLSDVLLSPVERPPWTRKPLLLTHPRTGALLLYVCEQNTKEIVGIESDEGEALLDALFDHMYNPTNVWNHEWRLHDLVCWDNLAVQHARPNVPADGPVRTLRKAAMPMPSLDQDQMPTHTSTT